MTLQATYNWNFADTIKRKSKKLVLSITNHEGPDVDYRHTSILSLTSALDVYVWSKPGPGRFNSGEETRYPLYRRLGGP